MDQDIRFCTAPDGVRIAYATSGAGPPLVKAANWLNHLQYDWESPIWRHMFRELSRDHQLVRYDERGNGMSDWDADDVSFDAWVRDLEAVVDVTGLERFALLGISQGAALSIAYAVRHPERVSHLILLGAWSRGWGRRESEEGLELREAMLTLIRVGWGQENPAFRQIWTSRFVPDGTLEHQRWYNELQRVTTSPANAVRLVEATRDVDITDLLPLVQVPTLVLHARGDAAVRFEHGQEVARGIPGARFVPLESKNHLLLEHEPAFQVFLSESRRFLGITRSSDLVEARAPETSAFTPTGLMPEDQLAQYQIESRLGAGGMGVVYKARDTKLRRHVALKVLSHAGGEDGRRRLLREARHAAALNHHNICTIHEVGHASGVDFIVMELVVGRPLNTLTAAGPLPAAQVESLGTQIADALAHAHEQGVIHGDLKSANVVVRDDGRAKVLDFGIARRLDPVAHDSTTLSATMPDDGVVGTPAYMAPEVLNGGPTDARSDVWSLGVLLFEMATGTLPFHGRGLDLCAAVLRDEPHFPRRGVSPGLMDIIRQCLEKQPERRVAGPAEVSKRLRRSDFGTGYPIFGGMFDR
ncbi:MAG: alpha/beta fold hydrolase [Vicinamibacterales bacterium]